MTPTAPDTSSQSLRLYNAFSADPNDSYVELNASEYTTEIVPDMEISALTLLRWEKTYFYLSESYGEAVAKQFVFAQLLQQAGIYVNEL